MRQRYKRPNSDDWSVFNFKVGETLYWESYTDANDSKVFDGDPITAADLGLDYLGDGEVTLEFKLASDPDSAYSSSYSPNAAHEYSVRITVAESDYYLEGVKEVTFTIYMPE